MKERPEEPALSRLRVVRLYRGRTQLAVSQRTRISPSRLSILERQLAEPTRRERKVLARLLRVSAKELFEKRPPILAEPELPTKAEKEAARKTAEAAEKKKGEAH